MQYLTSEFWISASCKFRFSLKKKNFQKTVQKIIFKCTNKIKLEHFKEMRKVFYEQKGSKIEDLFFYHQRHKKQGLLVHFSFSGELLKDQLFVVPAHLYMMNQSNSFHNFIVPLANPLRQPYSYAIGVVAKANMTVQRQSFGLTHSASEVLLLK